MSDAFEASLGKLVASAQRDHAEVADAERQARQRRLEAERAKAAAWQTHQAAFQEKIGSVLTPVWVTARRALTGNYHILSDRARIANDTDQWTYRLHRSRSNRSVRSGLQWNLRQLGWSGSIQ